MPAVLTVSADQSIQDLVKQALQHGGYEVVAVSDPSDAIRSTFSVKVDAIVLDDGLIDSGEMGGLCDWVRSRNDDTGIVFVTSPLTRLRWLPVQPERDEIVMKPFSSDMIRQAVERALKSAQRPLPHITLIGDMELDRSTLQLRRNGRSVTLSPTEFKLLEHLAQHRGQIIPAKELLEKVWGLEPGTGSPESIRTHIWSLRPKVRTIADGELIETVPRRGYRLAL